MHVLIVDDEPLARNRLRHLLAQCIALPAHCVAEAPDAQAALNLLHRRVGPPFDLILLDIHMPGLNGLELARTLQALPQRPSLVFVTAHPAHAVDAFSLDAVDYLTKPVRLERLQQAIEKTQRAQQLQQLRSPQSRTTQSTDGTSLADAPETPENTASGVPPSLASSALLIADRGRTVRVLLSEVLYLKAELKYLTVRTRDDSFLLEGALADLESRYAEHLLRIHRSALVSRIALHSLEKRLSTAEDEADGWYVRLKGSQEVLHVSRRQLPSVRAALRLDMAS